MVACRAFAIFTSPSMTKNILFVDSRVQNYQTLIERITADTQWVLLEADQDGLLQMQKALVGYSGLDSIQIVSHGSVGALYLGTAVLSLNNVSGYASQLQDIGKSLAETGDLLLYGCNVAQGNAGQEFINALAQATDADVAASTDNTGFAALRGNWVLEKTTGTIGVIGLADSEYAGLLAAGITVAFPSNGTSIVEGNSGTKQLNLTVALSSASASAITVAYSTEVRVYPGNAKANSDYIPVTSQITFAPGEMTKTISIDILGDTLYEPNETFYVDLVSAVGASIVTNGAEGFRNSWVAVNITNDDVSADITVGFPSNGTSIVEGNSGTKQLNLTVALSSASASAITVAYSTEVRVYPGNAKANSDYIPVTSQITFAPGEMTKTISIDILGDTLYEPNETFYVDLVSAVGASIVTNGAEGFRNSWVAVNITNDDVISPIQALPNTLSIAQSVEAGKIVLSLSTTQWLAASNSVNFGLTYDSSIASFASWRDGGGGSYAVTSSVSEIGSSGKLSLSSNISNGGDNTGFIDLIFTPTTKQGAFAYGLTNASVNNANVANVSGNYQFTIPNSTPTGSVTISGNPTQGQTLTAANTLADPDGLGMISYQWKADGVNIFGAIGAAYKLTATEVGKAITATAIYTDFGGTKATVNSIATAKVLLLSLDKVLVGTAGPDFIAGGSGNDTIDGGAGTDTAVWSGSAKNFTRTNANGKWTVQDTTAKEGTDSVVNVERLKFLDISVALDTRATESAGGTALLIGAVLPGKLVYDASKQALLGSVIGLFDQGFSLKTLSGAVMRLDIWGVLANGGNPGATNSQIADYLLTNVNGFSPNATVLAAGAAALDQESGNSSQGDFLFGLASSAANQIRLDLVGLASTGLEYM